MKASQFLISTLKEAPADAEVASHKLMMRAGLIKKLGAGSYTYMPMGLRVIRKVEAIVREEMNRAGAIEMTMPVIQPAELWQETGRFDKMGPELLRIKDALDLHLRTGAEVGALQVQVTELGNVADTLGMLGLGVARGVVLQQRDAMEQIVAGQRAAEESALLDVAGALLYVDDAGCTSWSKRKPVTPTASRLSTTPRTTWLTR